ncbi:Galactose/methyl galactoside import ATP-binding protein MglA [Sporomusa carbonis]|uniref:ABC transporter ATP-binding protein n=1 Tax=Sporomusa carbonis TaxID=3076075 RepID=UPI003A73D848
MGTPFVEMKNITKRFPGILANDNVNLTIKRGEIHALLGENGAGKSTLMSILTGLYRPDNGVICINGQPVDFHSPKDAVTKGIGMVHQHFKLVKTFTVAENIILGLQASGEVYHLKSVYEKIQEFCKLYGFCIDPAAKVWQLSIGEQQRAEIIKVLFWGAEILILDEPTAVLTPQEAAELYKTLRLMASQGKAVIVISHKLSEVMENTDTITVLRGGKSISTVKTAATSEEELTGMMVGRSVLTDLPKKTVERGSKILALKNVSCLGSRGQMALKQVSLDIYGGEILGIAGVAGNGQSELAEVIAGLRPVEEGAKFIDETDHTASSVQALIAAGVSYIPEDRLGTGLVPGLNAVDNFVLKSYNRNKGWFIDWRQASRQARDIVSNFDIKMANLFNPVKTLSGGNLQKLLLAREITANPRLIVAVYPMRGLDVGAMEAVRSLLLKERDAGKAVLLISEELDELFMLADRIAVLHEGEVMGIVEPGAATVEEVGMMMAGKRMLKQYAV